MIFNCFIGLDIGIVLFYLIFDNIKVVDVLVCYLFLWNVVWQNKIQWFGFVVNGNDLFGLVCNVGEVYGVFVIFYLQKSKFYLLGMDYLKVNLVNFYGLGKLEELIKKIGLLKWFWVVDKYLVRKGVLIFVCKIDEGGCVECYGIWIKDLVFWDILLRDVGSDSCQYVIFDGQVQIGVMEGVWMLFGQLLKVIDGVFDVFVVVVVGLILQYFVLIFGEKYDVKVVVVKLESVMIDEIW